MNTSRQEETERKSKAEMERQAGRRSRIGWKGVGQRELAVVGEAVGLQRPEWLMMMIGWKSVTDGFKVGCFLNKANGNMPCLQVTYAFLSSLVEAILICRGATRVREVFSPL